MSASSRAVRSRGDGLQFRRVGILSPMRRIGAMNRAEIEGRRERREAVAALTREGLLTYEIAARLNINRRTVARDRVALGIGLPGATPYTDEEHLRALEMLRDGCSLIEVARTLGRNECTIRQRYRGMGWSPREIGQYNHLRAQRRALGV